MHQPRYSPAPIVPPAMNPMTHQGVAMRPPLQQPQMRPQNFSNVSIIYFCSEMF